MSDIALASPTDESSSTSSHEISYSNNYVYSEFAGFAGERKLKTILRKILSAAHYRLWELLTDNQALGNDCFLSIPSLASGLDRGERAIRLSIQQLQARNLLTLRVERKAFRQADGSYRAKMVIVKDFSGLYRLAHEYDGWSQDTAYIAADREFAEVLCQDEDLMKKLRRFHNYRRVICDKYPGPKPKAPISEEDRWFQDYQEPIEESCSLTKSNVEAVLEEKTNRDRQFNSQLNTRSIAQNNSQERKNSTEYSYQIEGDSNDSGRSIEEGAAKDYTKNETTEPEQVRETLPPTPLPTKTTNPEPNVSETGGADQAARRDQQKAGGASSKHKKYQGDGKPRPVANAAISAYVRTFSQRLGDQNMRASETYLLRQAEEYSLSHPLHTLACLVRAHVEALPMQPKLFHPVTKEPLKMPLLNYLFKQFAMSFSVWSQDYLENGAAKLREDIEKDELLKLFVYEYQDAGAPSEAQEVVQDVSEPQIVFEELRIPSPERWMEEAEAEALVARIEGDRDLLEAEQMTVEFALIHRCRSLVRKEGVFIVEIELTAVNGAGQRDRWPMHLADESQWQNYCEEQKIFPRSKP